MNTAETKSAILVLEHGALWPGPMLDWADDVDVVSQGSRGTAERLVERVRRAALRCTERLGSVGCILVSFADAPTAASPTFRAKLVHGLGTLAPEIGCRKLILAVCHAQRLDVAELVTLARDTPFSSSERIEIRIRRAGSVQGHVPRLRR